MPRVIAVDEVVSAWKPAVVDVARVGNGSAHLALVRDGRNMRVRFRVEGLEATVPVWLDDAEPWQPPEPTLPASGWFAQPE